MEEVVECNHCCCCCCCITTTPPPPHHHHHHHHRALGSFVKSKVLFFCARDQHVGSLASAVSLSASERLASKHARFTGTLLHAPGHQGCQQHGAYKRRGNEGLPQLMWPRPLVLAYPGVPGAGREAALSQASSFRRGEARALAIVQDNAKQHQTRPTISWIDVPYTGRQLVPDKALSALARQCPHRRLSRPVDINGPCHQPYTTRWWRAANLTSVGKNCQHMCVTG